MLRSLSEQFARRAREFSDAVAKLGQHRRNCPELALLVEDIKQKLRLCEQCEKTLERYLKDDEVAQDKRLFG